MTGTPAGRHAAARGDELAPLYAIADAGTWGESELVDLVECWQRWGIRCIQLRAKDLPVSRVERLARRCADRLHPATRFWINDHADVARAIGATGVHLGQGDVRPATARRLLDQGQRIGRSTHNAEQALEADNDPDVDVIAVGPIFATRSKAQPDPTVGLGTLGSICSSVRKPVVAIGGLGVDSAPRALAAGAASVAMIGALRSEDPERTVRQLLASLNACRIPPNDRKE